MPLLAVGILASALVGVTIVTTSGGADRCRPSIDRSRQRPEEVRQRPPQRPRRGGRSLEGLRDVINGDLVAKVDDELPQVEHRFRPRPTAPWTSSTARPRAPSPARRATSTPRSRPSPQPLRASGLVRLAAARSHPRERGPQAPSGVRGGPRLAQGGARVLGKGPPRQHPSRASTPRPGRSREPRKDARSAPASTRSAIRPWTRWSQAPGPPPKPPPLPRRLSPTRASPAAELGTPPPSRRSRLAATGFSGRSTTRAT